jgi:hypothetical protein
MSHTVAFEDGIPGISRTTRAAVAKLKLNAVHQAAEEPTMPDSVSAFLRTRCQRSDIHN